MGVVDQLLKSIYEASPKCAQDTGLQDEPCYDPDQLLPPAESANVNCNIGSRQEPSLLQIDPNIKSSVSHMQHMFHVNIYGINKNNIDKEQNFSALSMWIEKLVCKDIHYTICEPCNLPNSELPNSKLPNSEPPSSEPPDSDPPDSEPPNSELPNSELSNIELPNSELPNSELSNSELTNSELSNSELPNSEPPNSELSNSELSNSELSNSELSNSELPNCEPPNSEPLNSEPPNSELPNSEPPSSEGTNSELNEANHCTQEPCDVTSSEINEGQIEPCQLLTPKTDADAVSNRVPMPYNSSPCFDHDIICLELSDTEVILSQESIVLDELLSTTKLLAADRKDVVRPDGASSAEDSPLGCHTDHFNERKILETSLLNISFSYNKDLLKEHSFGTLEAVTEQRDAVTPINFIDKNNSNEVIQDNVPSKINERTQTPVKRRLSPEQATLVPTSAVPGTIVVSSVADDEGRTEDNASEDEFEYDLPKQLYRNPSPEDKTAGKEAPVRKVISLTFGGGRCEQPRQRITFDAPNSAAKLQVESRRVSSKVSSDASSEPSSSTAVKAYMRPFVSQVPEENVDNAVSQSIDADVSDV